MADPDRVSPQAQSKVAEYFALADRLRSEEIDAKHRLIGEDWRQRHLTHPGQPVAGAAVVPCPGYTAGIRIHQGGESIRLPDVDAIDLAHYILDKFGGSR